MQTSLSFQIGLLADIALELSLCKLFIFLLFKHYFKLFLPHLLGFERKVTHNSASLCCVGNPGVIFFPSRMPLYEVSGITWQIFKMADVSDSNPKSADEGLCNPSAKAKRLGVNLATPVKLK